MDILRSAVVCASLTLLMIVIDMFFNRQMVIENMSTSAPIPHEEEYKSDFQVVESPPPAPVEPMTPEPQQISEQDRNERIKAVDESPYSQLPKEMQEPLGTYDENMTNKWDKGYHYLNTDKWKVPQPHPPVCIQEKQCPVCPSMTSGFGMDLMEFNASRKISNQNINVKYVDEVLNNPKRE